MMNPESGRMHSAEEIESIMKQSSQETSKVLAAWPRFGVGEQIMVKGHRFKLERIDMATNSIILRSWNLG